MKLIFEERGWNDYLYWQANDPKMIVRLNALMQDVMRSPFRGIGKPEPLRENWAGYWTRRIDGEHRMIYRVIGRGSDQQLEIAQLRYHYAK